MKDRKTEILELRKSGLSIRSIAKKLNIAKGTVEYHCNPRKSLDLQKSRRRKIKILLIKERSSKCEACGYDKSISALDFHHLDKSQKEFGISEGIAKSFTLSRLKEEMKKCKLLCSNCHHEVHDEILVLDTSSKHYTQSNPRV